MTTPSGNTIENVFAAEPLATGVCWVAPRGTVGPTSATDAFTVPSSYGTPSLWVDLGYTGPDGFLEKLDRRTTIKYSFGGKPIKVLQSEYSSTLDFTLEESISAAVLKAVFGTTNVVVTAADATHGTQIQVFKNSRKLPHQSWIIDTWDDELGAQYRSYVYDGQISTVADIKVVHTDTIEYKVTIECFESPAGWDNIQTFIDDGRKVVGP